MAARAGAERNITVNEYKLDSPVADIQWVGKDKKTVFVRTAKNFVYRSADEGRTWEKQNWKMERSAQEEDVKSGILSFHVSPADSNKIFFRGVGKQHWLTLDRGEKYMPLDAAFTIKEVAPPRPARPPAAPPPPARLGPPPSARALPRAPLAARRRTARRAVGR